MTISTQIIRSKTLVGQIVKAESLHLIRQIESLRTTLPDEDLETFTRAGALTIRSSARFGRKLNHTVGLGMNGPIREQDLFDIERLYMSTGLAPELDMCPVADPGVFALLHRSGYNTTGQICTFKRELADLNFDDESNVSDAKLRIRRIDDRDTFIRASTEGFLSGGRSAELLTALAKSAAHRPDTSLFLATIDGEIAGTAAIAYLDVGVKIANLFIDSTLPEFRGKGVHRALLLARLAAAKNAGYDTVIASARTGSSSARNIERAGLERVYTASTYTKDTI